MKLKIIGAAICLSAMLLCFYADSLPLDNNRYIEHIENTERKECAHDDGAFCSKLPLVLIDTGGEEIPGRPTGETDAFGEEIYTLSDSGGPVIAASVTVIDNRDGGNHPDDAPAQAASAEISLHGHESRSFEKASYKLRFIEDGSELSVPLLGMKKAGEWILHGPYLDRTFIRNYLWYSVAGKIMDYAPDVRFCEVLIDGDYRGLYLATECIDGDRLSLACGKDGVEVFGYLIELDRKNEKDSDAARNITTFSEAAKLTEDEIIIRYPGKTSLTDSIADAVMRDYSEFEMRLLYRGDYEPYIDVGNFIDYYIINEFSANLDAGRYSTYVYKLPNKKLKLCVWDFNNSCDNYTAQASPASGFYMRDKLYFSKLLEYRSFTEVVVNRYRELRNTYLSDDYLESFVRGASEYLGDAVIRNNERWADSLDGWAPLKPEERNPESTEEATEQLIVWMKERAEWLDKNIDILLFHSR